jgi:hypothetical protein
MLVGLMNIKIGRKAPPKKKGKKKDRRKGRRS